MADAAVAKTLLDQDHQVQNGHFPKQDEAVEIYQQKPSPKTYRHLFPQVMATVIVSWLAIIVGYASAYSSPAEVTIVRDFHATKDQVTWIVSLLPVGAVAGSLAGGPAIEYLGRKHTLFITNVIFLASWTLNFLSRNYQHLYVSRFLCGFAVGITSFTLPVYLAETVQAKIRGRLGLFPTTFGNFGILLCYALGNVWKWRGLAGFGLALSLPFLVTAWLIPDTPRWFVTKKLPEKARKSLRWFRGKHCDITKEVEELLHPRKIDRSTKIFTKVHVKALCIVLGLMFFQQFSGINAVIFYTTEIFEESGSDLDAFVATAIVGVVNFLSAFIATALVDHLGRKVLMVTSGATMAVSLTVLGLYFYLLKVRRLAMGAFAFVPILSFVLYVLGFSLGLGPIPWLMMGEILPCPIRGLAASVAASFNWTCTFVITKLFPIMEEMVGTHLVFWFFGVMMVCGIVFVRVFVPETKKRTLDDIEKELAGHKDV